MEVRLVSKTAENGGYFYFVTLMFEGFVIFAASNLTYIILLC